MPTIFTRIINGELPGTFVWRDDLCVAFLSINPLREGHTLVVSRDEIAHWLDAPADLRDHLFGVAQTIGRALDAAWSPSKVGLMIAGLEVDHLHLHVVPMDGDHDLDFGNAASSAAPESLEAAATRIRLALENLGTPSPHGVDEDPA
jgi:histidine triad (HIT) family protein